MTAPDGLIQLVKRFEKNLDSYTSRNYKETQVRREFVDHLFEELAWDLSNKKGLAATLKEVVHEDAIKASGGTKAPDYAFRVGGVRKFFVEAKPPYKNLKNDPSVMSHLICRIFLDRFLAVYSGRRGSIDEALCGDVGEAGAGGA